MILRKLICLLCLAPLAAAATNNHDLVAVSLQAAAAAVSSPSDPEAKVAHNLGGITRPVALIVDHNDAILVGEVVRGAPSLTLGDLQVALANADPTRVPADPCHAEDPATAPKRVKGLSLEPYQRCDGSVIDSDWSVVDYRMFSLKGSDIGVALTLIDTWLKAAAMGYQPIEHPSEFDLELLRYKLGFRSNPDRNRPIASFFYPANVPVLLADNGQAAVAQHVRIGVTVDEKFRDPYLSTLFEAGLDDQLVTQVGSVLNAHDVHKLAFDDVRLKLESVTERRRDRRRLIGLTKSYIRETARWDASAAKMMPYGVSPNAAFASMLSAALPEFEEQYPFLTRYRDFSALLGLVITMYDRLPAAVVKEVAAIEFASVATPAKVQTIRRGQPGFATPVQIAGGLSISARTVRLAEAGQPTALRETVLATRPTASVAWRISFVNDNVRVTPISGSEPVGNPLDIDAVMTTIGLQTNAEGDWEWLRRDPVQATENSRWPIPRAAGNNLWEVVGQLSLGMGHETLFVRPDELTLEPFQPLFGATYEIKTRLVFDDALEFGLTLPVRYEFVQTPASLRLPGIVDYGSVGGLSNLSLDGRYLFKRGAGNTASAFIDLQVTTPLRIEALNTTSVGGSQGGWTRTDPVEYPLGIDGWSYAMGVGTSYRVGERFRQGVTAYVIKQDFNNIVGDPVTDTNYALRLETARLLPLGRSAGLSVDLFSRPDVDLAYEVRLFLEKPTRNRALRYSFGLSREADGHIVYKYSLDVGVERLFKRYQKWF